ncbi:MAG: hypothetical protein WD431_16490 [Cyclobacteriaceae bacterium]
MKKDIATMEKLRNKALALVLLLDILITVGPVFSQQINPDFQTRNWNAEWVTVPNSSLTGYGV